MAYLAVLVFLQGLLIALTVLGMLPRAWLGGVLRVIRLDPRGGRAGSPARARASERAHARRPWRDPRPRPSGAREPRGLADHLRRGRALAPHRDHPARRRGVRSRGALGDRVPRDGASAGVRVEHHARNRSRAHDAFLPRDWRRPWRWPRNGGAEPRARRREPLLPGPRLRCRSPRRLVAISRRSARRLRAAAPPRAHGVCCVSRARGALRHWRSITATARCSSSASRHGRASGAEATWSARPSRRVAAAIAAGGGAPSRDRDGGPRTSLGRCCHVAGGSRTARGQHPRLAGRLVRRHSRQRRSRRARASRAPRRQRPARPRRGGSLRAAFEERPAPVAKRVRRSVGAHVPVVVGLFGGPADHGPPSPDDVRIWRQRVAALGDPWLRVEALST